MPHDDTASAVPYGYCQCGCGQKTGLAKQSYPRQGVVKGQPNQFLPFHNNRLRTTSPSRIIPIPDADHVRVELHSRKFPRLFALVNREDADRVSKYRWYPAEICGIYYAWARTPKPEAKYLLMHRVVLGLVEGESSVDHINGDGLDNRRENLRRCTDSQNAANRRAHLGSTSRYKGVTWHKGIGKWQAFVRCRGQSYYLGVYESEHEAALAYNAKAVELFGEFAKLNEVDE